MKELFGLSMTTLALSCAVATAMIFLFVGWIALRNPVMFKTGLRNIPRRPMQTGLIVIGLMLSTLIITAAFGVGDTMTHSVTREAYTILGPADEIIEWDAEKNPAPQDQQNVPIEQVERWQAQFKDDPEITAFFPYLREFMPAQNVRTRLNEANARITAFRPADVAPFGGLKDVQGRLVVPGPGEIAVNEELAGDLEAIVGDTIRLFYKGEPVELKVIAIVPNTLLGGTSSSQARQGAAVDWDFLGKLIGREGRADFVAITNTGTVRGGVGLTGSVVKKIEPALVGTPWKIEESKADAIEQAELLGNVFLTIFVIFGLFSIAAGVLLIFLIFVMLAAERKPEMGMARAVGAKRRQIVESFLAEGLGYDLGAAVLGLVAGTGVAAAMVLFVRLRIGEDIGINLQFDVTVRSLIVSFCIGVIVTFAVVFAASWRASRLNIVSAIRDLPESRPHNPEDSTWLGFLRGALNSFTAYGVLLISLIGLLRLPDFAPLFALAVLVGLGGLFISTVRNHNFGADRPHRKQGERLPIWPWFLPVIGWIGYPLAILAVRFARDRRPKGISLWLVVAGVVFAPVGLYLAASQDRKRPVAWGVGFGVVGLVVGVLFLQWGLDADQMALLALGISLIAFFVAITLRFFGIGSQRLVFTTVSAALMVLWYLLPGGRLEGVFGKLDAGPEMFFVTGAVLVTAGTFILVYNADIVLPALGAFGGRFGRIMPAVKMAVAYPLTSRFRTGLTIALIGLIMFVLSMQAAMNSNFEKAFTGDDARGGFDALAQINGNNRTDDLVATLNEANQDPTLPRKVDTAAIAAIGELRVAEVFEVDIEDPEWSAKDPATRDEEDQFKQITVMGADDGFLTAQKLPLQHRAAGYADDAAVWKAVATGANLAVIPATLTSGGDDFGPGSGELLTLPSRYTEDGFEPFTLNLRNRTTGIVTPIIVIGQTKDSAGLFFDGILVRQPVVAQTFPDSKGQQFFIRLKPGADDERFAKDVEAALVQARSESLNKLISDAQAQNRTFLEMFQGFLALGLLVGIAALGVVSLRAVVERRQQIGMLRAIGYKRSMVQLSFLLESGFIALSGIGLGLLLGISFAANLFTSGEFGASTRGLEFTVPWVQIGAMTGFAFVASMVTTYLPARAASRVAVAEALRYE